jgi:hypothetical protein
MNSRAELPNTFAPLALAIAAVISLGAAQSQGNDVAQLSILLTGLVSLLASTRYAYRAYRQLSQEVARTAVAGRWLMLAPAMLILAMVWLVVAGYCVIVVGIFVTGRGMVG